MNLFREVRRVLASHRPVGIFQYEILAEAARVVASVPAASAPSPSTPLVPYPWVIHFVPVKPLFPLSGFEVALSIADDYRGRCSWEEVLKWSRVAFDPLGGDNTWAQCASIAEDRGTKMETETGKLVAHLEMPPSFDSSDS